MPIYGISKLILKGFKYYIQALYLMQQPGYSILIPVQDCCLLYIKVPSLPGIYTYEYFVISGIKEREHLTGTLVNQNNKAKKL